ncbi:MAG: glycosyltransferase family 1 protein [Patescibacteria group bacterium]
MILGIDLRSLPSDGSSGAGIAHASRAITRALVDAVPSGWTIKAYIPSGASIDVVGDSVELAGSRRGDLIDGLRRSPCDLLFVPSGAVPLNLPVPAIPWVHDLDIFEHPEWFPQSWLTRMRTTWMFRRGIEKAPMVFCVSEYTRRQIGARSEERSPFASRRLEASGDREARRIVVTGEGGDEGLIDVTEEERRKSKMRLTAYGIKENYLLMLGTVEPRKNLPFALSVLLPTTDYRLPTSFVIAGSDGWHINSINRAIELASKQHHIIRLRGVSDRLRRDLLISASLVLVPSLSEGFGLVALEAMQAGVPVIASNRGALPEVAGESILPLSDPSAWTKTIDRILSNNTFRQDWIEKQKRHVSRYSWKSAAEVVWRELNRS